jgi:hypothetical protein
MAKAKLSKENLKYIKKLKSWNKDREKDQLYAIEKYDTLIVTLSSGALVLTVGFVHDIVTITPCTDTTFLKLSWYSLITALIMSLLSHIASYRANKSVIKLTKLEVESLEETGVFEIKGFKTKCVDLASKFYSISIGILNVGSFLVLILGIWLFIHFLNQNI